MVYAQDTCVAVQLHKINDQACEKEQMDTMQFTDAQAEVPAKCNDAQGNEVLVSRLCRPVSSSMGWLWPPSSPPP